MKIRTRATLLGMLPALLVAILLGAYLAASRLGDLEVSLHARGAALARHLAQGAQYGLVSGNRAVVQGLLRQVLDEPDVVYVGVYGRDGAVLAEQGRLPAGVHIPLTAGQTDSGGLISQTVPVELPEIDLADPFLAESQPVEPAGAVRQRIGWVRVVVSRASHDRAAQQMLFAGLGFTLLGLAFAMVLVWRLALTGVRPLMETIATVRDIASGNLDARLPVTAKSELKILQQDVNAMAAALRALRQDMRGQVEAATAELAAQKEAAVRADQAKSRFLAAASHDLRQPMHAIGLFVEALKPQLAGRDAAQVLSRIEVSVMSLEGLFNAILDVTRLDAGAVVPQPTRVDVGELLAHLRQEFQAEAEQLGIALRVRCCRDLVCDTDPMLLERILRNLLSNALHYTPAGGVLLSARRHGQVARIQVWDTGNGIAPEDQERVFEEFYQVDNPHRDRTRGLGLGLSIVKRLAGLLDYRLSLRTTPGRGSVFGLDVPARRPADTTAGTVQAPLVAFDRLDGQVLVVDDDMVGREALTTLLRGWGLSTESASGSAEALARFSHAPDVVLTDFHLSNEKGLAVVRVLRDAFPGQPFAVVVITADTAEDTAHAIRDMGLPVLYKPLRPAKLRALLTQVLRRGAADEGGSAGSMK